MLHRARTAHLIVRVGISSRDITNDTFLNAVRLAISHIRHIRHLSIGIGHSDGFHHLDLNDLLSPLEAESPDILETLTLSGSSSRPFKLYPHFKMAPNLCKLELNRCHVDWQLLCSFRNLTSLILKDIPISSRPSIHNILSVLQSMNKLESVELIHALPELPTRVRTLPPPQAIAEVRLEHLYSFSLTGFVLDCANLTRFLVLPRCRKLDLETESRWPLREIALALSPLSNIMSSILSESNEQDVYYIGSIQRTSDNEIGISLCPTSPHSYPYEGAEYTVRVGLTWRPSQQVIMGTFAGFGNILLTLPLSRVIQFGATSTSGGELIDSAEWLKMVRHLSRVKVVVLSGGYTYGFVKALHDAHDSLLPSPIGLDTGVLHDLSSLTIAHAHFSYPLGNNQLFSTLTRFLTRREELALSIPKIILLHSHITPQQLQALNRFMPEFVKYIGQPRTLGVGELDVESSESDEDN